jgi:hypothetical protein
MHLETRESQSGWPTDSAHATQGNSKPESRSAFWSKVKVQEQPALITEICNPQERIAAIARDYASNPEKTLIVSPDNTSRRDINQAVRTELQASGALGKENVSFPVLVARNDMTGADRAWAARYTPGDTVRYIRGSQELGLRKNTYATVVATDPANNLVTVARADGQHVAYDPQRLRGVNVYTNLPREFSTRDRIQFTHNNKDLDVHNRDRGRIEAIGSDNRLTVKMDDGNCQFRPRSYATLRSRLCRYQSQFPGFDRRPRPRQYGHQYVLRTPQPPLCLSLHFACVPGRPHLHQ